jgi:glycosyltransferase involved in cell wall biosynthesis
LDIKLTIAFPTPEFVSEETFGGLATYIYKTSIYLKALEHNPIIFLLSDRNEETIYENVSLIRVKQAKQWWFWFINIFTLFLFNPALMILSKSASINNAIRKVHANKSIDIIQYSNAQCFSILAPKSIPHCLRLSQYYYEYSKFIFEKPRSFRNRQKLLIEKLCIIKARNAIYGPSSTIGQHVTERLGIPVKIIRTPYFNLDKKTVLTTLSDEPPFILYFGTLSSSKGVDLIAEIIYNVLEEHKDIRFKFVGRNTKVDLKDNSILRSIKNTFRSQKSNKISATYLDLLKASAKEHSNRIDYSPVVKPKKMQTILGGACAVVLPSRIDNFPNTLSESLSLGKIVIVPTRSSLDEIVVHLESGFIFNNGDAQSLMHWVSHVLQLSKKEKLIISHGALNVVKSLYPENVILKDLYPFYLSKITSNNVRNSRIY